MVTTAGVQRVEDEELAALAYDNGDAFAELYKRHLCSIYGYIRKRVRDDAVAEDLTAQVFFRALRSASTFEGTGSYEAWLYRIARNCIASWARTKGRDMSLDDVPDTVDPAPTPAVILDDEESRGHVWEAVAELPNSQRETVVLRYMNDLSIDEIATITKKSPGAVRLMLHRARARLRKTYERTVG